MSEPLQIADGFGRQPSDPDSRHDEDTGPSTNIGNFAASLSRSVEIASALRSRSAWMLSSSPMDESVSRAHERLNHQRERSLSHGSREKNMHGGLVQGDMDPAARRANERPEIIRNIDDFDSLADEGRGLLHEIRDHREHREHKEHREHDHKHDHRDNDSSRSGHSSVLSREEAAHEHGSLSTFGQTLFNSCNMLMGVGLLSLPYAMRLAGWFGLPVLLFFSMLTCYTAKLLGKILEHVPSKKLRDGAGAYTIYGFHDMGELVFGEYGKIFISVIFVLETFGYCCVYLIIEGENLEHQLRYHAWFEGWGKAEFMSMSALIFLPSCLLRNLSWLSYFSALGVFSSMCLLMGVLATGLLPDTPPAPEFCARPACTGSLYEPSVTDRVHMGHTLEMLGLMMVGFAGHAVFPTLRNDMQNKSEYGKMVNVTYAISCSAYVVMACAGYLMFGNSAQSEITLNLSTKNLVAQVIIWIVIVNPVTKFALDLSPIAMGLEGYLALSFGIAQRGKFFVLLSCIVRTLLVGLALIIVISAPSFATVLGVLGSLCSFTISVAFPCWCYVRLFWNDLGWTERIVNLLGAIFGSIFAILGTWASLAGGPVNV